MRTICGGVGEVLRLVAGWKDILKKAWSVRLLILAGLLSSAEILLSLNPEVLPPATFAVVNILVVIAAIVARVAAQKDLQETAEDE